MIELKITGCCYECKDIDLKLFSETFPCGPVYALRCVHDNVCSMLERERFVEDLKASTVRVIRTPEANLRPMETRKE